jgi:hypothetical protein
MMQKLEKEITVLVCKLEKIFPPRWFNAMQHLSKLVHDASRLQLLIINIEQD